MGQVHFLPVDEVRVINDLITNYEEGRMMLAGKKYNVSPSGHYAEIGETAFWKPTLLNCNLGALIAVGFSMVCSRGIAVRQFFVYKFGKTAICRFAGNFIFLQIGKNIQN